MQSVMNNMVDDQLQSDFQLASLSSSSPPSSSSSSPCPGVTIAPRPQPSALPVAPSSPTPPTPASSSSPPPPCHGPTPSSPRPPSPGLDSTISAIARAHRETFLYAHDKLTNPHAPPQQQQNNNIHHNGEVEPWGPNRCPNGYHANGLNTIYRHNNNLLPDNSRNITHHHSNGKRSLHNSNLIGGDGLADHVTQGQNCPMKNHTEIVLVKHNHSVSIQTTLLTVYNDSSDLDIRQILATAT